MFFDTIEEYNVELEEIQNILKKMEKSIGDYLGQWGTKINYEGLKQVYNIILNDWEEFLKMNEETINLNIDRKMV